MRYDHKIADVKFNANVPNKMVPVHGLHHFAYRCKDAEETRHFYEDLLGLPLTHVVRAENIPSTNEYCPYIHLFFEMTDGSSIAFFDLGDNIAAEPSQNTPRWTNHIALRCGSVEEVDAALARLKAAGIDVIGPISHEGYFHSIYFFDPNGLRLELTLSMSTDEELKEFRDDAHRALADWTKEKAARNAQKAAASAAHA